MWEICVPVGRLHGPTPHHASPGSTLGGSRSPPPPQSPVGSIREHSGPPRKSISFSLPLFSVLGCGEPMDLGEPSPAHRGDAVAVSTAGVVAEPDLVLAPVAPTNGGVPIPRELGHRSMASAPRVYEGHGRGALGSKHHHGETCRTPAGAGTRWDDLKPEGCGWMTVVMSTLLG